MLPLRPLAEPFSLSASSNYNAGPSRNRGKRQKLERKRREVNPKCLWNYSKRIYN
jgi:hypothetical protein